MFFFFKAKLEHFRFQRDSVIAIQTHCRELALLLDCWNATVMNPPPTPVCPHNFSLSFHFFLVRHVGSRWAEGAGQEYVHFEPVALSRTEFQEKLGVLYEPVFGKVFVCLD